jgi:YbbR domain-containing protein
MKKIISAFLISSMFFISINMSFANNASSCKEEIIENANSPTFSPD